MIESIAIRDFRGIKSGIIDRFRRFNLLVGPNNSGKSAVIEALYLASTVGRSAALTVQHEKGVAVYDVWVARRDVRGQNPLERVAARHNGAARDQGLVQWPQGILQVTVRDQALPFTIFDLSSGEQGFFTEGAAQTIGYFGLDPQENLVEGRDSAALLAADLMQHDVATFANKRLLFCWQPDLTHYDKGSAAWLVAGKMPMAEHTLLYDSAVTQEHLPLAFYERMLGSVPGWTQHIARRFDSIFNVNRPFIVQFLPVGPDRQWMQGWIAPEDRLTLPIDAFGDGARSAFKLLTPLVAMAAKVDQDMPGLLLWEEPEAFQNPRTLGQLLAEVVNIVQDRPLQVFMVSHSLEVVAHITAMLQNGQLNPDDALVFRLDLHDGQLRTSWFDVDNLVAWLETGLDPRVWGDFTPPLQFHLRQEES